jgi:hypothetical protein
LGIGSKRGRRSLHGTRFIRPKSKRLLMAPKAANSRTSGPMETTREAMKTFLKAGSNPV